MARRDVVLQVRISKQGADAIDRRRGQWNRSEYVRQALAKAAKLNLKGPEAET